MISTSEALGLVLNQVREYGTESIPLENAKDRVLAEDILADRDWPPFDRVAMDGIAICSEQVTSEAIQEFENIGIQAAGAPRLDLENREACFEVMTGAVLPKGCDRVIPYEKTENSNGVFRFDLEEIAGKTNIHQQGSDYKKGEVLIPKYHCIKLADIAILASVGKSEVQVVKNPKVAVISTGDELVDIHQKPLYYQIRRTNSYFLVEDIPGAKSFHLNDDYDTLLHSVTKLKKEYDVLVFTGAVSKGKFDYLPQVFKELELKQLFHKVAQRPGKPMWFGGNEDCLVFGFPGNPVSSFMCYFYYFKPWLAKVMRQETPLRRAKLTESIAFKPDLTYFIPGHYYCDDTGQNWFKPKKTRGSGDFGSLSGANGILVLERGKNMYNKNETYDLILIS